MQESLLRTVKLQCHHLQLLVDPQQHQNHLFVSSKINHNFYCTHMLLKSWIIWSNVEINEYFARFHGSGETARPLCLLTLTCEDIYNGDEPTIETNLKRHNIPESDYGNWIENCIRYFSNYQFIDAYILFLIWK